MVASPLLPLFGGPTQDAEATHISNSLRVFHLHEGFARNSDEYDWMNSTGVYNPPYADYDMDPQNREGISIKKALPSQKWQHHFFLYPAAGSDIVLSGDMSANIWAKSLGNDSASIIRVVFRDAPPGMYDTPAAWATIGSATSPLNGPFYSEWQLYTLTLPGVSYTIQAGHMLALTVQRADSQPDTLLVWYDKTDYDSFITLRTTTCLDVSSAWTEDSYGLTSNVFSDQENATVLCNVTNPFGAYEISGATAKVTWSSNGTVRLAGAMTLIRTDPSADPYWKEYCITLPALAGGSYAVNVSASDPQGNPAWSGCTFIVITADHFGVVAPGSIEAGTNFTLSLEALDTSNGTVTNWVGTVMLEAYLPDRSAPASGDLSVRCAVFTPSDMGQRSIPNQTYSASEETIAIKASSGVAVGWSENLTVKCGKVATIDISPMISQMGAGDSVTFHATARDSEGNLNNTWTPQWTVTGGIGTITGSGSNVLFTAESIGTGNISCRDEGTGLYANLTIDIVAGVLARIVITPASDPNQVHEGESLALTAAGYDSRGNLVNISGATWDTGTAGSVSGTGVAATFFAGLIPESGAVHCRKSGVVGTVNVTIVNADDGPWIYPPVPIQIRNEDTGSWDVSLTGHWNHVAGTSELTWWAEGVNTSLFLVSHDPLSNAIIRFYTQPNAFGDSSFELWVIDESGYRARQTVSVSIKPVNDPPEFINGVPEQLYVKFDTPYTFDYTYYVNDVDNKKSDLTLRSDVSDVYFNGLVATFVFPTRPGQGSYFEIVTLTLSDGAASDNLKIVVWVTDDTPPSLNNSLPDQTMYEGERDRYAFNLTDYFYDKDGDYLVYSRGFSNVKVDIKPNYTVYLSAPYEWSGLEQGIFTATDGTGALKTCLLNITVIAVNDPPRILRDLDTLFVKYDSPYFLYLSSFVLDPDNSLDSLSFNISDPRITRSTGPTGADCLRFLFPGPLCNYSVDVTVNISDPDLENPRWVLWTFKVMVTNNEPPAIIAPNPDELYYSFGEDSWLNNTLILNELFSDPGDVLTYYLSGPDHIFARVFANSVVNLTASANWSGTETFNVTVVDSKGGWAFLQLHITVTPVNDAPVISPIPNIINKGHQFRTAHYPIYQYVFDSDNKYEELTVTSSPSAYASVVGNDLFISLPEGVNVITVTLQAGDGELWSNSVSFKVGVEDTTAEKMGWPYSFPLVLLAVGVAAYFFASRLPRPYALENLFLIHNDGRLVAHVTKEENTTVDKDVLSAMFTAVQEFVRDSFQKGEVGLKKLEIGDKNVVIEKGQNVYLALIYSGWPTKETFDRLPMLLRDVEERYKERIAKWNGTMKTVKGVDKMLQEYMLAKYQPGVWHEEEELAEKEWVDILTKEA